MSKQYCYFFDEDEFVETDRPGFRRRVITGEHLQMFFWRIKGGADGSFMHKHSENEQLGIIMRGQLEFTIDDSEDATERVVLSAGECYLAPRSIWHGNSVFIGDDELDECWIIDVFSPPRTDGVTGSPTRASDTTSSDTASPNTAPPNTDSSKNTDNSADTAQGAQQ